MFRSLFLVLLVTVSLAAPWAAAGPAEEVHACKRNCDPHVATLNGPDLKHGDEPVWTILYPHFDGFDLAPTNTQATDEQEDDLNRNIGLTPSVVLPWVGETPTLNFQPYTFVWFSSAGPVHFSDGEMARTHQEQGLAEEIVLEGNEVLLYFYLSAHNVPNHNDKDTDPLDLGVMPLVALDARMETGRNARAASAKTIAALDTGTGAAFGVTSPSRVDMIYLPGDADPVYEFELRMPITERRIPSDYQKGGYVVSVIVYQLRNEDESVQASQIDWRVRTGPNFMPRVIVQQKEPLVTKYAWMNLFDNRLFLRWSVQSVWGSYDMEPPLDITVVGPAGPVEKKYIKDIIFKYSVDHDGHFKPANQTWALDFAKAKLPDGDYVATGRVHNLQRTYELTHDWHFQIVNGVPVLAGSPLPPNGQPQVIGQGKGGDAGGKSPGVEASLLVALTAGVAMLLRRRTR